MTNWYSYFAVPLGLGSKVADLWWKLLEDIFLTKSRMNSTFHGSSLIKSRIKVGKTENDTSAPQLCRVSRRVGRRLSQILGNSLLNFQDLKI